MSAKEVNGVNVDALGQTIAAVNANPTLAKFRFQLKNEWIDGGHNRSIIKQFYGVGQDIDRPRPFTLDADEPPILLGNDLGPNAGEYLLSALAACVTGALVYHAAARGIVIDEVESQVEGDIDLRGFLGLDPSVRKGFQNIRMSFKIRADVTDEQLEELGRLGPEFSPVFDSITRGVPITVQTQRMSKAKVAGAA
ncbi:MAG TPA: OsmC family protein [Candidatus Angelobacter sp.]|jgi:uncharacterized OsmC-like protein